MGGILIFFGIGVLTFAVNGTLYLILGIAMIAGGIFINSIPKHGRSER